MSYLKPLLSNSRQHGFTSLPRAQECHEGDDNADRDDDDADHVEGAVVVPAGTDVGRFTPFAIGHDSVVGRGSTRTMGLTII